MILEELRLLIGEAPDGAELIEYVFVGLFCLFLVQSVVALISSLFRKFSGGG